MSKKEQTCGDANLFRDAAPNTILPSDVKRCEEEEKPCFVCAKKILQGAAGEKLAVFEGCSIFPSGRESSEATRSKVSSSSAPASN